MIGTKIKIKNHNTGQVLYLNDHETDPNNVIALQSFPSFEADIRGDQLVRQGAHGEFRLPTYYGGMSIVLQGVIAAENEANVWAIKKQLDDILRLSVGGLANPADGEKITPEYMINEIKNPSGSISAANWTTSNSTVSKDPGASRLAVIVPSTAVGGISQVINASDFPMPSGKVYKAACDIENTENGNRTFRIRLEARDGSNSVLISQNYDVTIATLTKQRVYVTLGALPANVNNVRLEITRQTTNAAADDLFFVSRVIVMKDVPTNFAIATDYFDGDSVDLELLKFEWAGAIGLSATKAFRYTLPSMYKNLVRLSFTNPNGKEVFIDATPIKVVSYDRPLMETYLLNFQVILRANFPNLLSLDDVPNIVTGDLGSIATGFKLPFQLPFNLNNDYITGAINITMQSPGYALIRMFGSDQGTLLNPKVTNLNNDKYVKIQQPLIGANRYFLIDGVMQRMTDETGKSVQQYADGDFLYLEAGTNTLLYTADALIPN